jgi:hypothetical protein
LQGERAESANETDRKDGTDEAHRADRMNRMDRMNEARWRTRAPASQGVRVGLVPPAFFG